MRLVRVVRLFECRPWRRRRFVRAAMQRIELPEVPTPQHDRLLYAVRRVRLRGVRLRHVCSVTIRSAAVLYVPGHPFVQ